MTRIVPQRGREAIASISLCLSLILPKEGQASERPPFTDYCQRLEQEIQGRKHGFLAGNVTYYVGGLN